MFRLSRVAQALSTWSWVFHVLSRMFLLYSVYWLHAVVALC